MRASAPESLPDPAPFVVGVARSGTTLLKFQLGAGRFLSIGPETGWGLLIEELIRGDATPGEMAVAVARLPTFPRLELTVPELTELLASVEPWNIAGGLRALYRHRARCDGKPRWGDKTPLHIGVADQIAALLPETHVIHIIRDGRGILASVRGLVFAPGDGSIEAIADDWDTSIRDIRAAHVAGRIPHYREVRYERLVSEPEAVLRELCAWLGLPFDPAMLEVHEAMSLEYAKEPTADVWKTHSLLTRPPDPSRTEAWRDELSAEEIARFEAVAGRLLSELGYERAAAVAPLVGPA